MRRYIVHVRYRNGLGHMILMPARSTVWDALRVAGRRRCWRIEIEVGW